MDASDILENMLAALRVELGDGFETIGSFAKRQGRMLAQQAEHIAKERAGGFLKDDDELFQYFLDGMKRDAEGMANSIATLTILTIEKAWNALANALWGGVRAILTSAGIPAHLLPETPSLDVMR